MSLSRCIRHWWYRIWWVRTGSIMACCGGQRELTKSSRGKAAQEEKIGKGKKREEIENKNHAIYERRVRSVFWEKVWWRDCEKEKERVDRGNRGEKSISQSLFIKWCSATERWNNQKPNRCTVRGNDREEGNSHLDRTVESKPISTCWHTYIRTNTDSLLWPSYIKRKSLSATKWKESEKGGRGGFGGRVVSEVSVHVSEGMWRGKWDGKQNRKQSVVGKCLTVREPIYRIISGGLSSWPVGSGWETVAKAGVHTLTPCHHMREEGAMHVLISATGEGEPRPGGYKQCCHVALGPSQGPWWHTPQALLSSQLTKPGPGHVYSSWPVLMTAGVTEYMCV